jgi:hypothetical protein
MNKVDAKILIKNGAKNWSKNVVYRLTKWEVKNHQKSTRFGKKYSLFVGNDDFIGSFLGVKKGGGFFRKVQNYIKFLFLGPGSPRSIFDDVGPPVANQFLSKFGSILYIL